MITKETIEQHVSMLPNYMQGEMLRYILHGIPPGNFLAAVLANDLMEALERADDTNINLLPTYARFLYNYAPAGCFGSPTHFREWRLAGGLNGHTKIREEAAS